MASVCIVQHVEVETPGILAEVLQAAGVSSRFVRIFRGEPIPPSLADAAGVVVMGGPMGVYEQARCVFLADELRLIEQALHAGTPVLGVCLGSQLLAAALGTPVTPGARKEIGWHRVSLTPAAATDPLWAGVASSFMGYHWHGDVFELPHGATALAASELTPCQAFRYDRSAYGLLFHLEVTAPIVTAMVAAFTDELTQCGIDGDAILQRMPDHLPPLQAIGRAVLTRWARLVTEGTPT